MFKKWVLGSGRLEQSWGSATRNYAELVCSGNSCPRGSSRPLMRVRVFFGASLSLLVASWRLRGHSYFECSDAGFHDFKRDYL